MPDVYKLESVISSQSQVDAFKNSLADIRLKLNSAISRKRDLAGTIKIIQEQRDQIISLFVQEVKNKYPDLVDKTNVEILNLTDAGHPCIELYQKYHKDFQGTQGKYTSAINQFKSLSEQVKALESEQYQIIKTYETFASTSSVEVPSVEQIEKEVVDELPSSFDEDTKIIESYSALDLLKPDAANAIILQQAEGQVVDDLTAQVPGQVMVQPEQGLGKVWTIAGILALAYIFIGG